MAGKNKKYVYVFEEGKKEMKSLLISLALKSLLMKMV